MTASTSPKNVIASLREPASELCELIEQPEDSKNDTAAVSNPPPKEQQIEVFGIDLSAKFPNRVTLFIVLASTCLVSSLVFAYLQESVFRIPGFTFGGWMTIITLFTYICCGAMENLIKGDTTRKGLMKDYILLAVFVMFGTFFTNMLKKNLEQTFRVFSEMRGKNPYYNPKN